MAAIEGDYEMPPSLRRAALVEVAPSEQQEGEQKEGEQSKPNEKPVRYEDLPDSQDEGGREEERGGGEERPAPGA